MVVDVVAPEKSDTYTNVDSFKLAAAIEFNLALLSLGTSIPSLVAAPTAEFAAFGFISKVASGLFVFIPTFPVWEYANPIVSTPNKIMCFFIYLFLLCSYSKINKSNIDLIIL